MSPRRWHRKRSMRIESLENRRLLAWQNPIAPMDVNDDGVVSALDALQVVNHLNSTQSDSAQVSGQAAPPYYDVNDDGAVSALDALIVINELNRVGTKAFSVSEVLAPFDANEEDAVGPASWPSIYGKAPVVASGVDRLGVRSLSSS